MQRSEPDSVARRGEGSAVLIDVTPDITHLAAGHSTAKLTPQALGEEFFYRCIAHRVQDATTALAHDQIQGIYHASFHYSEARTSDVCLRRFSRIVWQKRADSSHL